MKIIVTGATGNLGTLIADHLALSEHEVIGIDRVYRQGRPYPIRIVDLLNRDTAYEILPGVDAIVHLANHAAVNRRDEQTLLNENIAMNTNLFQAAVELGIPKILFASSIQVMTGDRLLKDRAESPSQLSYLPLDADCPAIPGSAYGLSKYLSEEMLRYHARSSNLQAVTIRLPFVLTERHVLRWFSKPHDHYRLDEAFCFLAGQDIGPMVEAVLKADLPGYRAYFPTNRENLLNRPPAELIKEYFPEVPLKVPLDQLTCLADNSSLERETGWIAQPFDFPAES